MPTTRAGSSGQRTIPGAPKPCRRLSIWLCLGGLATGLLAISRPCRSDQVTLDDIITVAQATREAIQAIDMQFETVQTPVTPGAEGHTRLIPSLRERTILDTSSRSFHWYKEMEEKTKRGPVTARSEYAYDRGVLTSYEAHMRRGLIEEAKVPPIMIEKRSAVMEAAFLYPPKERGHGVDDGSLVSLLRRGKLRNDAEEVDDRRCHVVDASAKDRDGVEHRYATVWIDLERGALPIRTVGYDKKGGVGWDYRLKKIVEFLDQTHHRPVWLPTLIEKTTTVAGVSYAIVVTVDPKRTVVNPAFKGNPYVIDFPPGTTVVDAVKGVSFNVPGKASLPSRSDSPAPREPRSLPLGLIAANLALAGAAYLLWQLRLRKTRPPRPRGDGPESGLT